MGPIGGPSPAAWIAEKHERKWGSNYKAPSAGTTQKPIASGCRQSIPDGEALAAGGIPIRCSRANRGSPYKQQGGPGGPPRYTRLDVRTRCYSSSSRLLRAAKANTPNARATPATPAVKSGAISPVFADLETNPAVLFVESSPGLPVPPEPLFPDPSFEGSSDIGESGSSGVSGAESSAAIVKDPGISSAIS